MDHGKLTRLRFEGSGRIKGSHSKLWGTEENQCANAYQFSYKSHVVNESASSGMKTSIHNSPMLRNPAVQFYYKIYATTSQSRKYPNHHNRHCNNQLRSKKTIREMQKCTNEAKKKPTIIGDPHRKRKVSKPQGYRPTKESYTNKETPFDSAQGDVPISSTVVSAWVQFCYSSFGSSIDERPSSNQELDERVSVGLSGVEARFS